MRYDKIDRYCELIATINSENSKLRELRNEHHEGGYSFEDIYVEDIKRLHEYRCELRDIIKFINS